MKDKYNRLASWIFIFCFLTGIGLLVYWMYQINDAVIHTNDQSKTNYLKIERSCIRNDSLHGTVNNVHELQLHNDSVIISELKKLNQN